MTEATYDAQVYEYEDFFEAYLMASKSAFVDLVVENEQLIIIIDEFYDESIEQVYDVSLGSR
jgi:hypothetical protein